MRYMDKVITVRAAWDSAARVWVAESDDLPLATESPTVEALGAKLPGLIEDLLEEDDHSGKMDVSFELVAHLTHSVRSRDP
jgi:hypothetical protein